MELANIRTRQDLIDFFVDTGRANAPTAAETTEWFVLCASARDMLDGLRVQDLAIILREGITPFEHERDIDAFLLSLFYAADQARKEGEYDLALEEAEWAIAGLMEHIEWHFGR